MIEIFLKPFLGKERHDKNEVGRKRNVTVTRGKKGEEDEEEEDRGEMKKIPIRLLATFFLGTERYEI